MVRQTIPSALPMILGWLANRNLRGNGTLSTHWRMGSWGNTSSTSKAALSAIRRAPQLGQKPLPSPKALTVGATEGDQMLRMAFVTLHSQKTMLKTTTF